MPPKVSSGQKIDLPRRLEDLRNVGRAALEDFKLLGISSIPRLAQCDAESLYLALQRKTKVPQDPCVWDVFAATIHQARTGEALDWWKFTPRRRELMKERQLTQRGSVPKAEPTSEGRASRAAALLSAAKRARLSG